MSKLLIVLTRLPDFGSRIIGFITRSHYTHASIALEEDPSSFYSFTLKGFRIEHPKGLLGSNHVPFPCRIYSIDVPESIYQKAKRIIGTFTVNKEKYHYSVAGIILALFHIPLSISRQFYCSHFVADILERSGAMNLQKQSCLYMPCDLQRLKGLSLCFAGTIQGYAMSLA